MPTSFAVASLRDAEPKIRTSAEWHWNRTVAGALIEWQVRSNGPTVRFGAEGRRDDFRTAGPLGLRVVTGTFPGALPQAGRTAGPLGRSPELSIRLRLAHYLEAAWNDWRNAADPGRTLARKGEKLPLTDMVVAAVTD